jgi:PAS domain S-box-containing protein
MSAGSINKQKNKTISKIGITLTLIASVTFSFYGQTNFIPPAIITAGKPEIIEIPTQGSRNLTYIGSEGKTEYITLYPPKTIHPAVLKNEKNEAIRDKQNRPLILGEGGFSNFTNYTTDHGLALDVITSSCRDHFGNLWFGTDGGGISRYDGKSFVNYTTAQGMTNNSVWSIMEDRAGNIWIGTNAGISKYDGHSFTNYKVQQSLSDNHVSFITEDKYGNMWFGSGGGGALCFDGKSFLNYTTAQGLPSNSVSGIVEDKEGNLWFGTLNGLSLYNRGTANGKKPIFTNFTDKQGLISNNIWRISQDKAGNIWIAADGGVSRYNVQPALKEKELFTNFTTQNGLASNFVWDIFEDKSGNIWFGTSNGVTKYDGKSFTSYTKQQGLAGNVVWTIAEDRTGNIWFGTYDSGVSCFNGKAFSNFTTAQGLIDATIWSICKDKNENFWFGTNKGASYYRSSTQNYDQSGFTNYTTRQGLANNIIWSLLEDRKGNIWFGTNYGLSFYNGKSFTNYTTKEGLVNNTIIAIMEEADNIWLGTFNGLSRFDGNVFINYTTRQGLVDNNVRSLYRDSQGNCWIGTDGGISKFNLSTISPKNSLSAGKAPFINYTTQQGLAGNSVSDILEDKAKGIWIATDGGLCRFDGNSFLNYTKQQGLHDNVIVQLALTSFPSVSGKKKECLVLGTNYGIAVLTGWKNKNGDYLPGLYLSDTIISNEQLKIYTPVFEIYNSSTGYPIKDVNAGQNTISVDSTGVMWIATGAAKTGLVRFDPSALNHNLQPLSLVIQSVKINEEDLSWSYLKNRNNQSKNNRTVAEDSSANKLIASEEVRTFGLSLTDAQHTAMSERFSDIDFDSITRYYPLPVNLVLPFKNNNITFDFAAIEPSRPHLVKYQYILEGYNKEWSPLTNKTTATFGNIHEGNYSFMLKALSRDGVWSNPVTYTFKVLPPLYRTWWAYCLYLIAVSSILFFLYRWRTIALRKDKELLEEIVKERTLEVVKQNIELEKLSIVASETDNGVLICGPKGEIEWANTALTRLLGYTFDELKQKGNTIEELSSNPDIKQLIHQSIKNKKSSTYQVLNVTKDGQDRWTQSTLTPILDERGDIKKLVVIDTDISERKKIEEMLSEKNKEMELSHKTILILSEIGQKITSTLSIEKIVEKTYASINSLMEADTFCIGLHNKANNSIEFPGFLEKGERFDSSYNLNDDTALPVICFKNQQEIFINDYEKEYTKYISYIPSPVDGERPESTIYVPLFFNEKVIGVINAASFSKNAYTDYHLNILKNLAVYIAIAIQNAGLYETLEDRVKERTTELVKKNNEVESAYRNIQILSEIGQEITSTLNIEKILDTVYKKVNSLMDATIFGIGIYYHERNCIEYKLAIENGKKYEAYEREMVNKNQFPVWCVENRQPVFINDVHEEYGKYISSYEVQIKKLEDGTNELGDSQSIIYLPIQIKDRVIGVITVQSHKKNAYTQNHLEILQTLASYIAIALDNARLYDNMEGEIKLRTKEIENQKILVEEKNLKITDSINYALRIQQAILPSQQMISSILPDSFVFFKPKDIVSGDFYWAHPLDEHQILFAAVDCTGHGVPGAFMSIMGYNLLEQIVKEQKIHEPALILDELSRSVVRALKQTGQVGSIKEGMDIALCKINYLNNELEYAGAHNPLTLIRNKTIMEIKANRKSIGISSASAIAFTNHKIKLEKGDCIYIFSDGYADQKGGLNNQKFFYQPFRELLLGIHGQSMNEQEQTLQNVIVEWKGSREQIDDILVIGVRV